MSQVCTNWSTWLSKTRFSYMNETQIQQTLNWLLEIKNEVLNLAQLEENQKIADFGCGEGLLGFGVLERFGNKVELIFSDKFPDCLDVCKKILETLEIPTNVKFLQSDLADIKLKNDYLDRALTRSVLVHILDKKKVFSELYRVLKNDGYYCAFEPIISQNTRYYELLLPNQVSNYFEFKKAEEEFMSNKFDPLVNFNINSLENDLKEAGFSKVNVDLKIVKSKYIPSKEGIENWFIAPPSPNLKSMKERFLDYFEEKKVNNFIEEVKLTLCDKEVKIYSKTALIKAMK